MRATQYVHFAFAPENASSLHVSAVTVARQLKEGLRERERSELWTGFWCLYRSVRTAALQIWASRTSVVGTQAGVLTHRPGTAEVEQDIAIAEGDGEHRGQSELVESSKVDVGAIHYVEGPGFCNDPDRRCRHSATASGDAEKCWDVATPVEQAMQLDRGLDGAEMGLGRQVQAQINGGRIQCLDVVFELHGELFTGVERPRDSDQYLGEVGEDAPIVCLASAGQGGTRHLAAQTQTGIALTQRPQIGFDVAQTLAVGKLREEHTQELSRAGEPMRPAVVVITSHHASKIADGKEVYQRGEDGKPLAHGQSSAPDPFQIAARENGTQIPYINLLQNASPR